MIRTSARSTIDRADGESLRFRLRAGTRSAHEAAEAVMDLEGRCRALDTYRDMIARLWGLYAPLEAALARIDHRTVESAFAPCAKTDWLVADLLSLGLSPSRIERLPRARGLPTIAGRADAFGVLYVLEGATLGGQIILRRLEADLGVTARRGARFFASYGAEVAARWRCFVAELDRFGADSGEAERVERAALAAFASFQDWMGPHHATTTPLAGGGHGD